MQLITDGALLSRALLACIGLYRRMAFASAWASSGTPVFEALLRHRDKIERAVVGTHFYQTDPQVLRDFVGSPVVRFRLQPSGVFHPKVFLFWSGKEWAALLGSANLTRGAFGPNAEVMLHVTSDDARSALGDELRATIEGYWREAKSVSEDDIAVYSRQHAIMRGARARLSGRYGGAQRDGASVAAGKMGTMTWDEFVTAVRSEGRSRLRERLALLERVALAFRGAVTFADIDDVNRAAIAGLPMRGQPDSGWFGSMGRATRFSTAVREDPERLSNALDCIPVEGQVTRLDFDRYVTAFAEAFPVGGGGIATATRLLAMKRPDQFLCLDSANRDRLRDDLGLKSASFDPARYWDEVIERIRDSPWWNAPPPRAGDERQIWGGRAAFLDAIYYAA